MISLPSIDEEEPVHSQMKHDELVVKLDLRILLSVSSSSRRSFSNLAILACVSSVELFLICLLLLLLCPRGSGTDEGDLEVGVSISPQFQDFHAVRCEGCSSHDEATPRYPGPKPKHLPIIPPSAGGTYQHSRLAGPCMAQGSAISLVHMISDQLAAEAGRQAAVELAGA